MIEHNKDIVAPYTYTPDWWENPHQAFKALWEELAWKRIDNTPRREYYSNDVPAAYTYGRGMGERTYEVQPWHPVMRDIQKTLETQCNCKFEVCFLNGYEDGKDQLGWHADDSKEMDDARPIAIVSLGAEREIWFKVQDHLVDKFTTEFKLSGEVSDEWLTSLNAVTKVKLGNGSLTLMKPGMQDTHFHRIPKSSIQNCGPRVSLTFRGYVE